MKTLIQISTLLVSLLISTGVLADNSGCTGFNCQPPTTSPEPINLGCTGFNCQPQYPNPPNGGECYPNSCFPGGIPVGTQIPQPQPVPTPIYVSRTNGIYRIPVQPYTYIYVTNYLRAHNFFATEDAVVVLTQKCLESNMVQIHDPYSMVFNSTKPGLKDFHLCLLK